jgi:hypothetical protein
MNQSIWCKAVQRCKLIKDEFKTLNGSVVTKTNSKITKEV